MISLPPQFCLQDISAITASVFELKVSPHKDAIDTAGRAWFKRFGVYNEKHFSRFFSHMFAEFAAMSFPDADLERLETCYFFFLWAFAFDDLCDEGDLQSKPDCIQFGWNIALNVLEHPDAGPPEFPYAAMLHDIWTRMRKRATTGACNRFAKAVRGWCDSHIKQAGNRAIMSIPSVAEFIVLRRRTIGGAMVEAFLEYSLDLDIPDYVFEHPVLAEISIVTNDITTWPNDIISFNKEQADGDYSNLVYCVMVERNADLQTAIDIVIDMVARRVEDYVELKNSIPTFSPDVDIALARWIQALEHFVQASIDWYYSPRYFRDLDVSDRSNLVVSVFPPTVPQAHL